MKKVLLGGFVLALVVLVAVPALAKTEEKVDVCHVTGNGSYQLINVNGNAEQAHLNHGDVKPGTGGLNANCAVKPAPKVLLEDSDSYEVVSSTVEQENMAGLDYKIVDNGDGTTTFCLKPTLSDGSPYLQALTVGIATEAQLVANPFDSSLNLTYGSNDGTPPADELGSSADGYCYTASAGSLPSGQVGIYLMVNERAPNNGSDLQRFIGIDSSEYSNDWSTLSGEPMWSWTNRFIITLP